MEMHHHNSHSKTYIMKEGLTAGNVKSRKSKEKVKKNHLHKHFYMQAEKEQKERKKNANPIYGNAEKRKTKNEKHLVKEQRDCDYNRKNMIA